MYHMNVTAALIADAARVESGKLYVHGGAWDVIYSDPSSSFPVTHPTMALALNLRVEYNEALTDIPLIVELLDEDDNSLGPRIEGVIHVGHAPRTVPGTPAFVPQAITFNMLQFDRFGGYRFRISSVSEELASVPFRLLPRHPS
jgi:hypothetical protein